MQDNPAKIGGWAVNGCMGGANIITTLADEGFEFSVEQCDMIRAYALKLLAAIGEEVRVCSPGEAPSVADASKLLSKVAESPTKGK